MKPQTLTALTLLAALLATMWTLPAQAHWPTSIYRNLPVAANDTLYETNPIAFPYGSGRTLVVLYRSYSGPSYQIVDRYGNFTFAEPQSAWPAINHSYMDYVKAVLDSTGGAIITWDAVQNPTYPQVGLYSQRIDSLGNRLWNDAGVRYFTISCFDYNYSICPDGQGGFWGAATNPDPNNFIRIQHVNAAGQILWGENGMEVPRHPDSYQEGPSLAPDGTGGFYLTYRENHPPFSPSGYLYMQRFDSTGSPLWNPTNGVYLADYRQNTESFLDVEGGLLVLSRNFYWNAVYRVSPFGIPLWDVDWISGGMSTHLVMGEPGYFYIGFEQIFGGAYPHGMYALKFDLQGIHYWPMHPGLPMIRQANWGPDNSSIAYFDHHIYGVCNIVKVLPTFRSIVTFRAQILDEQGHRRFNEEGIILSIKHSNANQQSKTAVPDGEGGLVGVFADETVPLHDVWAKHMNADGSIGGPMPPGEAKTAIYKPVTFEIRGLDVKSAVYVLPQAMQVKLELFNILGARVKMLQDGYLTEGSYTVQIDNRSLPSGIYFLRLKAGEEAMVKKLVMLK